MALTLRLVKGSALSYAEGDANFTYLLTNMSGSTISITGSTGILGNTTITGSLSTTQDAIINGLTIGKGNGSLTNNTALGYQALISSSGDNNVAVGFRTLTANVGGSENVAVGRLALQVNTSGAANVAIGDIALGSNTTGNNNMALGPYALFSNTTGQNNTGMGTQTLNDNTTGGGNIGVGRNAGRNNTTGNNNTYIGTGTGLGITTGNNNTIIGAQVTGLASTLSNNIIIADGAGNRRININAAGNVGIGTTSPTFTLEVNGTIGSTGFISSLGLYTDAIAGYGNTFINLTQNTEVTGYLSATDVLTLPPQSPLPSGKPTGSFAVSGSGANCKPYFYNGTSWTALF